jgi:hypothetical protein
MGHHELTHSGGDGGHVMKDTKHTDMPNGGGHSTHTLSHDTYFSLGHVEIILFEAWSVDSQGLFAVSCIILLFVSFLYEGLKIFRQSLLENHRPRKSEKFDCSSLFDKWHLIQTVLHGVQVWRSHGQADHNNK